MPDLTNITLVQLYKYLSLACNDKFISLKTTDIFYIKDNNLLNNVEKIYFTFNDSSVNQDSVRLCLYIYPKYKLNQGYLPISSLVENFLINNSLQGNKKIVETQMSYIKIKSDFIDVSNDYSFDNSGLGNLDKFKTTIMDFLSFVKTLLSFVAGNVDFKIEINLSKLNHLDLLDCISDSTKTLSTCPEALKRVLKKYKTNPVGNTESINQINPIKKKVYRPKLLKAKDTTIIKDNKIPISLKKVLNNE